MLNILAESVSVKENYTVQSCVISLDKGYLILITDQENFGIGHVILSSPPTIEGTRAISTPSPLFGLSLKRDTLSKMISELSAKKLKKPCLVLFHIKGMERKDLFVSKCVVESVKKALDIALDKI
jgi:hypothetical protein